MRSPSFRRWLAGEKAMTRAEITNAVIDPAALVDEIRADGVGGIATFFGTVRDAANGREVVALEYSSYEAMATRELESVVAEAAALGGASVIAVHRIGSLRVGDICVGIAAAHAHRAAAFDACRYVIEEIKKRVPIWKREQFADGEREWVNCEPSRDALSDATIETVAK